MNDLLGFQNETPPLGDEKSYAIIMRTNVSEVCITASLDTMNVGFICYYLISNNVTPCNLFQ